MWFYFLEFLPELVTILNSRTSHDCSARCELRGLLGSSALATVEGFAITAENYAKAVEILKDRFGRKDAIINSHMQKLLSVTPLKRSDDTKVLRQFFDMCQTQIRSLESLDVSFESFSNVLCPLILNCLPSDLVLEFNKETDGSEYKLDELLKFLNKQISARERTESSISTQYIPHSQRIQPSFNRFKSENYKHNSQKLIHRFESNPSLLQLRRILWQVQMRKMRMNHAFSVNTSHTKPRFVLGRNRKL
ncbi:DUF1758 domain-containing protein [Trichonephila clavipes]|nr:DUF1758 domain-containing protein [Trichonephila clavipes]